MDTVTKVCCSCKTSKSISEFYFRGDNPTSECKACMKMRSKHRRETKPNNNGDYMVSYVPSENMAIEYLSKHGIPALPGKAIRHSYVDVIAFGCIGIEVKYALLASERGVTRFKFATTPAQQKRGFRGDVVLLICDYGDNNTYHLFPANHPVFYMGDRLKTGFTFTPGAYEPLKHGENRVVMTQGMMNEAEGKAQVIFDALADATEALKDGKQPKLLGLISE